MKPKIINEILRTKTSGPISKQGRSLLRYEFYLVKTFIIKNTILGRVKYIITVYHMYHYKD